MAKTSFQGPVRSKENFKLYSVTDSTGVDSDRTQGFGIKDARRFYLEEYFYQRPGLNAVNIIDPDADNASDLAITQAANKNFETLGTSYTTALTTFASTSAGILMTTATSDQDQAILLPHLDTNQTAWSGTKWGTENQVEWECSLQAAQTDNEKIFAGLKLTGTAEGQEVATDNDQVYFKYQTDADNSEAFSDYSYWHLVHSIGGTDYISQTPVAFAADTPYHLKIVIDSDRKMTYFINGIQYHVTTTSGSTGGTAVTAVQPSETAVKSAALTNDVNLIPYIGIENGDAAAAVLNVHYTAISRHVYE